MPVKYHHIRTRLKMSKAKTGKPKSEEHKKKISETRRAQEEQKRRESVELEYLRQRTAEFEESNI